MGSFAIASVFIAYIKPSDNRSASSYIGNKIEKLPDGAKINNHFIQKKTENILGVQRIKRNNKNDKGIQFIKMCVLFNLIHINYFYKIE